MKIYSTINVCTFLYKLAKLEIVCLFEKQGVHSFRDGGSKQ